MHCGFPLKAIERICLALDVKASEQLHELLAFRQGKRTRIVQPQVNADGAVDAQPDVQAQVGNGAAAVV